MALNPLSNWQQTHKELKKVINLAWASKNGDWYNGQLVSIATDPSVLDTTTGFTFTFGVAAFVAALSAIPPTIDQEAAANGWASAWAAGMTAAVLVVSPGAFVPPPPNPTGTFSAVLTSTIDPPSIVAGQDIIADKMSKKQNGLNSKIPEIFREATLKLTITVAGSDSTSPTPVPLTVANVPLL